MRFLISKKENTAFNCLIRGPDCVAQAIAIIVIKRRHFIKNVLIKMGLVEKIKEIEEEMART